MANPTNNRIFFLHVPKTAGTSFNEAFRPLVPKGRFFVHMEERKEDLISVASDGEPFFASGHLPFESVQNLISRKDVYSIAIFRNPVDQLISHLKWVKAYGAPTSRLRREKLAPFIAEIACRLWDISLSDHDEMIKLLRLPSARQLFDNVQTRYLSGAASSASVDNEQLTRAVLNIEKLSFIFCLEQMDNAVRALSEKYPGLSVAPRLNESQFSEPVDIDNSRLMAAFLPLIEKDIRLHEAAHKKFVRTTELSGATMGSNNKSEASLSNDAVTQAPYSELAHSFELNISLRGISSHRESATLESQNVDKLDLIALRHAYQKLRYDRNSIAAKYDYVAPSFVAAFNELENVVQKMQNSTSWRITAPLRGLLHQLGLGRKYRAKTDVIG